MADVAAIICQRWQMQNAAPTVQSGAGTALALNINRAGFMIQNLGTNPLYVCYGATASTSQFHQILKASAVQDDGSGGFVAMMEGVVFTGLISVAGTSPRYCVLEI